MRQVLVSLCSCVIVTATMAALPPARGTRAAAVRLVVTPNPVLADQPVALRLSGLTPGQPVLLDAQFVDTAGYQWDAYAAFRADARGAVDPATHAPQTGSYSGVQPMGLLWSASWSGGSPATVSPAAETLTLTASAGGQLVAHATTTRYVVALGVRASAVRVAGLYGELYRPTSGAPAPGVLVLGGSEGGLSSYALREAALLADHGYAALALAYFKEPGLPPALANIPLEYFGRALSWLSRQSGVRADRLAVVGSSRGGELALLLGTRYPQLRAVVSYVGSGVVGGSWPVVQGRAAWTWHGVPLPFRTIHFTLGVPIAPQTIIPVERIAGPVLLLAAADDHVWPSPALLQVAWDRLRRYHHPYADQVVIYPGAGHSLLAPYIPLGYLSGQQQEFFGGTPASQAAADVDAWRRTLAVLATRLGLPRGVPLPPAPP